jgi:hypothetical protein
VKMMVAGLWLVLLVGILLGALTGAAICFKVIRDEMLARVRPQLNVVELKIDNLRGEVDMVAQRQEALRREVGPVRPGGTTV